MRRRKNISHKVKTSIAVVVDGETEVFYLQMLKRNERRIRVNIEPKIPSRKSLQEQYELALSLLDKEFAKVFWIVDLDVVLKEDKETPKGQKTVVQQFLEYREKLIKEGVVVIVNNPCLEFWFLLHFEQTSRLFSKCTSAEKALKTYLSSYEKKKKYLTKQDDDIYLKLKPYLKDAIFNSSSLGNFNNHNPKKAMCEMEKLFQTEELKGIFE